MARFEYRGNRADGSEVRGLVVAADEDTAFGRLREMGVFASSVRPEGSSLRINIEDLPPVRWAWCLLSGGRIRARTLALFTRQFASLLAAGIPLRRTLQLLASQSTSLNLADALERIGADIDDGVSLAESFARRPAVFPRVFVSMVRAGEESGSLENVLRRLAFDMERRQSIRGKVRTALVYPTFVLAMAVAILTLVLIFIVPKFEAIYSQFGAELPRLTQVLVFGSEIILHNSPAVVACLLGLWVLYLAANAWPRSRHVLDALRLRVPIFGPLLHKSCIARACRLLSTTIESGVPILESFRLVSEASGNTVVDGAIARTGWAIRDGETLADAVAQEPVFPPLLVQMMAIGEETGEAEQMLTRAAEIYEEDVDNTVKGLASILEPALIVCLGIFIGFVVIALYLPLFMAIPKL